MDGSAAIERNRVALKRIVASLIAMAGLDIAADPHAQAIPEPIEGRLEGLRCKPKVEPLPPSPCGEVGGRQTAGWG